MKMPKLHWPGILSGLVTIVGVAASPAVFALLPVKAATLVTVAGAVLQGLTKPVAKKEP